MKTLFQHSNITNAYTSVLNPTEFLLPINQQFLSTAELCRVYQANTAAFYYYISLSIA